MPSEDSAKIHTETSDIYPSYQWLRMFQSPKFGEMIQDHEITGVALRVYLGLLYVMDFNNEVCASLRAISRIVDDKPPNVCKALRILREKGIITRTRTKLDMPVYKISEDYVLKGDIKPLKAVNR